MLNFLIARLSSSQTCRRKTQLGSLHRSASHIFNSFSSAVKLFESNQPKQKQEGQESFTVSYLINSCGLSAKVAIEVSNRVQLNDPTNHDSVLNLLRGYGFSEIHISKLVCRYPRVLLVRPEKTLLPKLRFVQSIVLSCSELPELFISNPKLLAASLMNGIIPCYEALKDVLDDDEKVNMALKRTDLFFKRKDVTNVAPNMKILRDVGVPQSSVALMLTKFTSLAFVEHAKLVESVKFAKETGILPSKTTFITAIYVHSVTKKSSWEAKLDIFERCGWPRDITLLAFRKSPYCMLLSEEKIRNSTKFLMNEMCLPLKDIAECASLLGYSLDKRIIPRLSVVKLLKMKDLIQKNISLISIVTYSEKKFLEKFVIRFQESVPQILNIYKGQM